MHAGTTRVASFGLTIVFLVAGNACRAEWDVLPVRSDAVASHIRVDSTGTPHIGLSAGGFRYSTLVEGAWDEQHVLEFGKSFAFDANDDLFFLDTPRDAFFPELQVRHDSGLVFSNEIIDSRIGTIHLLGFDSENRPHVAYNLTGPQQLIHSHWDGSSWNDRIIATDPEFRFGNPTFVSALDANDEPHFVWEDDADNLQYSKPLGFGRLTTNILPGLDGLPQDLAIDSSGNAHLAHYAFSGGSSLTYATNASGVWDEERVPLTKPFSTARIKIVLDAEERPNLFNFESLFSGPVDVVQYLLDDGDWQSEIVQTHADPQFSGPDQIEAVFDGERIHLLVSTGDRDVFYAVQTPDGLAGDYNLDGSVNAADYTLWRDGLAAAGYGDWAANYGAQENAGSGTTVPEPASFVCVLMAVASNGTRRRR